MSKIRLKTTQMLNNTIAFVIVHKLYVMKTTSLRKSIGKYSTKRQSNQFGHEIRSHKQTKTTKNEHQHT